VVYIVQWLVGTLSTTTTKPGDVITNAPTAYIGRMPSIHLSLPDFRDRLPLAACQAVGERDAEGLLTTSGSDARDSSGMIAAS